MIKETLRNHSARQKEVLLLQNYAATDHSLIGRTPKWGVSSVFISLSLTLMDWFGFTFFANTYLEKRTCGIKEDLEAGRTRKF
jgi:hypothetical protein